MKRPHDYTDADLPVALERYPDFEDVPEDIIHELVHAFVVTATCNNCGHEAFYVDTNMLDEPECRGPDCEEQILLD